MSENRNLSGCQVFKLTEAPSEWDCVPLKERIVLQYGRALKEGTRKQGDVLVFGSNGQVGSHNEQWLDGPGVLVGRKGTVGAVHYTESPFWPIDTAYYVQAHKSDSLRYLYYLLDYLPLKSLNAATGVPGLSRRDAYALLGTFPPSEEQSTITRVLDMVGKAIGRAQIAQSESECLKRALTQDFLSKGTQKEATKKTSIGDIPLSWEVQSVRDVVREFEYGLSLPMSIKGNTPILRMGNIQGGDVVMEDLKYVTLPSKTLERYRLRRGDVLFNRTNSQEHVGKLGIYRSDDEAVFASYLIRLIPDSKRIDNYYLGQLLSGYSAQCRIKRYATPGVQQVNINAKNLGKVLIPVPCGPRGLDEQREIAAALENADKLIRSKTAVVKELLQVRKSLTHDLLRAVKRLDPTLFKEEKQA